MKTLARLALARLALSRLALARLVLVGLCAVAAQPVSARHLKVLVIGNSFSVSLHKQWPAVAAAAPDCSLDFCTLYIGGCSLERHWRNVEAAATNATFRPYQVKWSYTSVTNAADAPCAPAAPGGKGNIPQLLAADRWDVVTVQQASHESWKPSSYTPSGDNLLAKIRELAPQAAVWVQETWAYPPDDARYAKWGLGQEEMYARLKDAYAGFAAAHGLKVIPTGDAVQMYRRALPVRWTFPDAAARANLARPALPDFCGDPCGNASWRKAKDGTGDTLVIDFPHLNRDGHYLQACVWTAALFGADVTKISYAPKGLAPARAALLRACAQKAVAATR